MRKKWQSVSKRTLLPLTCMRPQLFFRHRTVPIFTMFMMHPRTPDSLNISPCRSKKEKRLQQEELRNIKTLGESGEDVDDLAAWVERNRKAEAQLKAEERAKAEKLARQLEEQVSLLPSTARDKAVKDSECSNEAATSCHWRLFYSLASSSVQDDVDSDEEAVTNPQELAGMKVKHNTEELKEGETMILTLADRSILNDKGDVEEDPEELENVLVVCSPPCTPLTQLDIAWSPAHSAG